MYILVIHLKNRKRVTATRIGEQFLVIVLTYDAKLGYYE